MLPLTPPILCASYDYLRATPPFRAWNLPAGEALKFHVLRTKRLHGDCFGYVRSDIFHIRISTGRIGRTHSLMEVMAHEMIHYKQARDKTETPNTEHNKAFYRIAAQVCRVHGFDPKLFV